jgi:hypothetical protein
MTNCPNCGHDLSQSAVRFCVACGQPLPGDSSDTVTAQRPAPPYGADPYAALPAQDPYAAPLAGDPYAAPPAGDPYAAPRAQDPYGVAPAEYPYSVPPAQEPYPGYDAPPMYDDPRVFDALPSYGSPPPQGTLAYAPPPPDSPHGRRAGHQKSRSPRNALIIGLVAVVVLGGGAGAYVLLHHKASGVAAASRTQSGASTPATQSTASPQPSSSQQAPPSSEQDQVTQFLPAVQGSASARALVATAVPQVASCATPPSAGIAKLQQAVTDRQHVTATLSGLPVSQIPNGQTMSADLASVLRLSITADHDFISWMQDPATVQGCPGGTATDASYAAGLQASAQAVRAKKQFLALWNPLAKKFGHPTYTTLDI